MIIEFRVTLLNSLLYKSFTVTTTSEKALKKYMNQTCPNTNYEYKEVSKWVIISV